MKFKLIYVVVPAIILSSMAGVNETIFRVLTVYELAIIAGLLYFKGEQI